jgi:hypothetical protein
MARYPPGTQGRLNEPGDVNEVMTGRAVRLYNSLTRRIESLEPVSPRDVGIYTCGPTVYQYAHVGNLRSFLSADVLRRTLQYADYSVRHVKNITDVGQLGVRARTAAAAYARAALTTGDTDGRSCRSGRYHRTQFEMTSYRLGHRWLG